MNLAFIFVALLMVGLTLVMVARNISEITGNHQQISLETKGKKKPQRDQFPDDTQPGTAPGGAVEDRSDETDKA